MLHGPEGRGRARRDADLVIDVLDVMVGGLRDAVFAQFGRYGGETNGTFRADLKQVFGSDNGTVVAMHHNSGERDGKRLATDCCIVFEVKNGQVVSGREHFFDLHNWDAFWA